jgi:hypothetical protein
VVILGGVGHPAPSGDDVAFAGPPPPSSSCSSGNCPVGTATISGTVTQAGTDAPLQAAAVTVTDADGHSWTANANPTGGYTASSLPASTYTVRFSATGQVTQWYSNAATEGDATPVVLADGEARTGVDAALDTATPAITGTLTDSSTGDPVAGVCVFASPVPPGGPALPSTFWLPLTSCNGPISGPTGKFAVGGVTSGTPYGLEALDPLGRFVTEWYQDQPSPLTETPVTPTASGAVVDMALDHGGTLSGAVRDAGTDAPVSNMEIDIWPAASGGTGVPAAWVFSAADGTYQGPALAPGAYLVQAAKSDSKYATQWFDVATTPATAQPVSVTLGTDQGGTDFSLVPGAHISGTVVNQTTGQPIASQPFVTVVDAATGTPVASATTDPSGGFTTPLLGPGEYAIGAATTFQSGSFVPDVVSNGYLSEYYDDAYSLADATHFTITDGTPVTGIVIDLQPALQSSIRGVVTDAQTGDPVDGASISVRSAANPDVSVNSGASGADGTYAIPVNPGSYLISAVRPGYSDEWYDNQPTSATATVVTVTDADVVADMALDPVASPTPVGDDVQVKPIDPTTGTSPVTIVFSSVTDAGATSVSSSSSGPPPPSGFALGNPPVYYELSTTATFDGPVTVCFSYDPSAFPSGAGLALGHFVNGAWQNITSSIDPVNHVICGTTMSFSPFTVFEAPPCGPPALLRPHPLPHPPVVLGWPARSDAEVRTPDHRGAIDLRRPDSRPTRCRPTALHWLTP